jgi:hypothetical protein
MSRHITCWDQPVSYQMGTDNTPELSANTNFGVLPTRNDDQTVLTDTCKNLHKNMLGTTPEEQPATSPPSPPRKR